MNNKLNRTLLSAIPLILSAAVLLPLLATCFFMLPCADEMSTSSVLRDYLAAHPESGRLPALLTMLKHYYITWGGNTAYAFFVDIFPLFDIGISGMRALLFINALLYFVSLFALVRAVFFNLLGVRDYVYVSWVFAALCFLTTQFASLSEVFLWFGGAANYTAVMTPAFFGLALALSLLESKRAAKRRLLTALAAALFFLSCSGSLVISAPVCFALLCVAALSSIYRRRCAAAQWLLFASAFAGALVNAIAPGNFARHEVLSGAELSLFTAVKEAGRLCLSNVRAYLPGSPIVAISLLLLVFVAVPACAKTSFAFKRPLLAVFAAAVAYFSSVFPHVYAASGINPPARCYFVYFCVFSLCCAFIAFYVGGFIAKRFPRLLAGSAVKIGVGALAAAAFALTLRLTPIANYQSAMLASALASGETAAYRDGYAAIIEQAVSSPDGDVVIYGSVPELPIFPAVDLQIDPEYWRNIALADYSQKDSVSVIPQ